MFLFYIVNKIISLQGGYGSYTPPYPLMLTCFTTNQPMPNKSTIRDYHYDKSVAKVFGKTKMSMKNFFLKTYH